MFTGIVRQLGTVLVVPRPPRQGRDAARARKGRSRAVPSKGSFLLRVRARLGRQPKGASIAINGTCLTVVRRNGGSVDFDVSPETLRLTNLGGLVPGDRVNIEPPLTAKDPIGGHWVSGHVDAVAKVLERERQPGGFMRMRVALPSKLRRFVALKGSIAVDGTSLTVTKIGRGYFESVLIPETLSGTTLGRRRPGDKVNLEVDLLARYLERLLAGRRA